VVGRGPDKVAFSYSVGLWSVYQHPELFIFGLPPEMSNNIAAHFVEDHIKGDDPIVPGKVMDCGTFPLVAKKLSEEAVKEYMLQAGAYHGEGNFDALMIVWPDQEDRFPWDEGYDSEQWDSSQPRVWED